MAVPDALLRFLPRLVLAHHAGRSRAAEQASEQRLDAAVMLADVSGFTKLAERLAQRGSSGAEDLTRVLNAYFGPLIERIHASGGDVVKFAGDALIVLWPAPPGQLESAVWRAAHCGLQLQRFSEVEQAPSEERLSLKVSVGCGPMRLAHLGGRRGRWEVLVTGEGLSSLAQVTGAAEPGQVLLTESAASALGNRARVETLSGARGVRLLELPPAPAAPAESEAPPAPEAALRGYVPEAVLDRLAHSGEAWLSELRPVTVLFVNFPNATYQTPLDRAQAIMEVLQATLERFEGTLNKISVDEKGVSVVAAFGLPPLAHGDDPARGALAALALREQLTARGAHHAIGIATGRAFCGVVGSAARCEYTVMGDTVNLAARLMQAAHDDALCDGATADRASRRLRFEALPPMKVKGKSEPQRVHRPLGEAGPEVARAALVGRAAEREQALAHLRALAEGRPAGPVLIEGEPGIGKSRLLGELVAQATALGLAVLPGAADPVESATPYRALGPALSRLLGLECLAGPERARAALAGPPELQELLPLLAGALDLELPESATTRELTGPLRADRTRALVLELLGRSPGAQLLAVEDAHWLDSASWSALLAAARASPRRGLLLTTRPPAGSPSAEQAALLALPGALHLRLGPLSDEESLRVACDSLGVAALPPEAAVLVVRRGAGHPFFTEELALALRDSGRLRVTEGRAELAGALEGGELPPTVEGLVAARVDRLPQAQQLLLKAASAIGRAFPVPLLAEVHPLRDASEALGPHLESMSGLGLLELEAELPERAYRFKHALTREAVYQQVLRATRRELHRAVAGALERRGEQAGHAAALAHHWAEAGEEARATAYLELAGARALEGGAYREAASFLRQALERPAPAGQAGPLRQARLRRLLGDACLSLGDLAQSRAELEQAVALLGHPAPRPGPAQGAALVAALARRLARHALGPRRAPASAEAREAGLEGARAFERLGQVCFFFNEPLATLYASALATELAEPVGPGPELTRAYANLCLGLSLMPLPPAAQAYEVRARQALTSPLPHASEAWARMVLAMKASAQGRYAEARADLARANALNRSLGDARRANEGSMIEVGLMLQQGQASEALTLSRQIVAEGVAREDVHMQSGSNAHVAACLLRLGRPEEARPHAERGAACAEQVGALAEQVYSHGLLARARLELGDRSGASESVRAALRAGQGLLPTAIYALEGYAAFTEVAVSLGDPLARSALASLRTYARTFRVAQPRLQVLKARQMLARGHTSRAEGQLRQALAQAQTLSQPYDELLALDALATCAPSDEREGLRQRAIELRRRLADGATPATL